MKLRNYQKEAEESTFQSWKSGSMTTLGVMPTGCGKTLVFSSVIRRMFPKRSLVIAHRQELIWQARDKIKKVTGLTVDIEMGEFKSVENGLFKRKASVIVSTVQTMIAGGDGAGRIGKFDPSEFGLLVIDEAHHATSPSYRKVINYFMSNPKLVVLGVTATPDRGDEEALGQVFETVAFDYEILDAIRDGWLIPIEQQMVSVDKLDFSSVRTVAGDLNGADLAAVMESEKNLHEVASSTIDIVGDRRGLGFASSVNHARIMSEIFNRHKAGMSSWVSAGTDKDERKKIVNDFANGKIQWLWNCGVFTEGFDDSGVEVISMARPTKSRALYAQMAGRATRPHESIAHSLNSFSNPMLRRMLIERSCKPSCLIIDFVGNSGKHKLVSTADILNGNVSDEAIATVTERAVKHGRPMRMDVELAIEEERVEATKKRKLEELARKERLVGKATYSKQSIDPFDILAIKPVKTRGWDQGKELSFKQRELLKKSGFNPDNLEYGRARQLVTILIDRWTNKKCTLGQAKVLKKFDCDVNMSFEQASKTIDAIAKNNWKKPEHFEAPPQPNIAAISPPQRVTEDDNIPF